MELVLKRIAKQQTYTIGRLYVVNEQGEAGEYLCDTLEPTWRDYAHGGRKIAGRSAIPEGRYTVVITKSPKFGTWLPQLVGNRDFNARWQGVRIHAGNSARDTEGCILPGENRIPGRVLNSRRHLANIIARLTEAYSRGESAWMTVI
jgi:hypothetical protein